MNSPGHQHSCVAVPTGLLQSGLIVTALLFLAACDPDAAQKGGVAEPAAAPESAPVVVFATFPADALKTVLDAYSSDSGTPVSLLEGDIGDLRGDSGHDGRGTHADLVIARSVADLWRGVEQDVFRPSRSAALDDAVPAMLADPERRWFPLVARNRQIVFRRDVLDDSELATLSDYRSLADPRWRGRLCLSASGNDGNRLLVAMLIARHGLRKAELAVRGWRENFAVGVRENDAKLLEALERGACHVGLAASADIVRHRRRLPESRLEPYDFAGADALVDVIGAGVARHAVNPDGARALLEWLVGASPRGVLADASDHFVPAQGAAENTTKLAPLGYFLEDAALLAQRARYP